MQLLLAQGANASALDGAERTPLDNALEDAAILQVFQDHAKLGSDDADTASENGKDVDESSQNRQRTDHDRRAGVGSADVGHSAAAATRDADKPGAADSDAKRGRPKHHVHVSDGASSVAGLRRSARRLVSVQLQLLDRCVKLQLHCCEAGAA